MTYSTADKLRALAIVAAFETGSGFGKFSTVAVLDDGAGISYGFSQFTHRSGALAAVLERYRALGGTVGIVVIANRMKFFWQRTPQAITQLAADIPFRNALRAAGITDEMKRAQVDVALERFLTPAALECERMGFTSPLALAVIHDSIVHGSWKQLSEKVAKSSPPFKGVVAERSEDGVVGPNEKRFITNYVTLRDAWLASIPRLASTRYRTRFFLNQIKLHNWELNLPVRPNGVTITAEIIDRFKEYAGTQTIAAKAETRSFGSVSSSPAENVTGQQVSAVGPLFTNNPQTPSQISSNSSDVPPVEAQPPNTDEAETRAVATGSNGSDGQTRAETRPSGSVPVSTNATDLDSIESRVNTAAAKYDQVERIATTVTNRNDAAKSLWTTVIGSVTQTSWALFGLLAGVPRDVWLVVALIAAALMLMYLYRQIALGKIRETKVSRP